MAHILLLEDDKALSKGIQIALFKDGHKVTPAYSFFEGAGLFTTQSFDLFLLDVGLPDASGLAFCKKIRESSSSPVIFLTANDTEADMLEGFDAGCDEYIAKPFSVDVLRKRVLALLRRVKTPAPEQGQTFSYGTLFIDYQKMQVKQKGVEIKLTATEYRLLTYLAKNKGKVLTRAMLLEQLWDVDGNFIDENTLSVHVRRLRQKLGDDTKNPQFITTVFGIGYTFGGS